MIVIRKGGFQHTCYNREYLVDLSLIRTQFASSCNACDLIRQLASTTGGAAGLTVRNPPMSIHPFPVDQYDSAQGLT